MHDFAHEVSAEEVRNLTQEFEFLRLLTNISEVPQEELIAATVREARTLIDADEEFLVTAGQTLSSIFRNDYDRLLNILKRLRT
ncbi:MAG: hypothetical protein K2Z81_10510 [Cyanobacteria bacterium]|nr:hypothetical protein [Cyanobacteriota bacterium]